MSEVIKVFGMTNEVAVTIVVEEGDVVLFCEFMDKLKYILF